MRGSKNDMPSIVLTKEEHQAFTNAWRHEIGYSKDFGKVKRTDNVDKQTVIDAAKRI